MMSNQLPNQCNQLIPSELQQIQVTTIYYFGHPGSWIKRLEADSKKEEAKEGSEICSDIYGSYQEKTRQTFSEYEQNVDK